MPQLYDKAFKDIDEQIQILRDRNMVIADDSVAEQALRRIGYYNLSGYSYRFRQLVHGDDRKDEFVEGTKFEHVLALYEFDRRLRRLLLGKLEAIEQSLKITIALVLGKQDPWAHRKTEFIRGGWQGPGFAIWKERIDETVKSRGHKWTFIKHFREKYGDGDLPIWIEIEIWDFGMAVDLLNNLAEQQRCKVAEYLGLDPATIADLFRVFKELRNSCSHHERIWNNRIGRLPVLAEDYFSDREEWPKMRQLPYGALLWLAYLDQARGIAVDLSWRAQVADLLRSFPTLPDETASISDMGVPEGWANHRAWK